MITRFEECSKGDFQDDDEEDEEFTQSSVHKRQKLHSLTSLTIDTQHNLNSRYDNVHMPYLLYNRSTTDMMFSMP